MDARAFDLEGCVRREHVAESKPRLGRHDCFLRALLQEPARRAFRRRPAFASNGKPTGRGRSSLRRGAGYSPRGGCFIECIRAARGGATSCGKGRRGRSRRGRRNRTCHCGVASASVGAGTMGAGHRSESFHCLPPRIPRPETQRRSVLCCGPSCQSGRQSLPLPSSNQLARQSPDLHYSRRVRSVHRGWSPRVSL
jgi:hypothetical protein